ncbi:MAG: hypothetical protein JSW72_08940 [Candidatus Bathyarchaeota archaeon]|nr:MAG: hypothetical protein JSW72_08940 [Candidatus Bathyarchaeota archaeon]
MVKADFRFARAVPMMSLLILIITTQMVPTGTQATNNPLTQLNPSSGDWDQYHNYTAINDLLLDLNTSHPSLVEVFSIGESHWGKSIYCTRLTNENLTYEKPEVFFVGYHHARELISAELPLYFIVSAVENYDKNLVVNRMLDLVEIYVVVALNVDAFDVAPSNEWQRKNVHPIDEDEDGLFDEDPPDDEDGDGFIENLVAWDGTQYSTVRWEGVDDDGDGSLNEDWLGGVDLNRNYGYEWNSSASSGSPHPSAEDYRGPEPFSEPETRALRDLVLQHEFEYAISFHSGAENIVYPWGYTSQPTQHDQIFREVAGNLSLLVGGAPYYQAGSWYTTSGVFDDWMYGARGIFAFTCEIYTDHTAWHHEPGPEPNTFWERGVSQFFNPNPLMIETTVSKWMPVFFYIANRTINERGEDLNLDGKVDIHDLAMAAHAFGSRLGHSRWLFIADMNQDGRIDIRDIALIAKNFGDEV